MVSVYKPVENLFVTHGLIDKRYFYARWEILFKYVVTGEVNRVFLLNITRWYRATLASSVQYSVKFRVQIHSGTSTGGSRSLWYAERYFF